MVMKTEEEIKEIHDLLLQVILETITLGQLAKRNDDEILELIFPLRSQLSVLCWICGEEDSQFNIVVNDLLESKQHGGIVQMMLQKTMEKFN